MKLFVFTVIHLLLASALAGSDCLSEGRWGYLTSPDRSAVQLAVHEIQGVYVLHRCDGASCEVIQAGSYQSLCSIEQRNHRIQRTVYGVSRGIASESRAVEAVQRAAVRRESEAMGCPGTELVHSLTLSQEGLDQKLYAYYQAASHFDRIDRASGGDSLRQIASTDSPRAAINNFASMNLQHTFVTAENTEFFQGLGEMITTRFRASPDGRRQNYCSLFSIDYNEGSRSGLGQ